MESNERAARSPSFNLVDEPWIRVRYDSDELREVSLREVFAEAGDIRQLCNDLPTQDFAILRVLLAIFQRSLSPELDPEDSPAEVWGRLWRADGLPCEWINQYLDEWHDLFDLFDAKQPFMQVAGMRKASGEFDGVGKLIADVPDGLPFFAMRSGRELTSLTYAEAARWLVHAQAFDPGGIKSGVLGDPNAKQGKSYGNKLSWAGQLGGLYVRGEDLSETLLLNLVLWRGNDQATLFSDDDLPCWELSPQGLIVTERNPEGFADSYTWQSRRILLRENDGFVDGVLITNGTKLQAQNRFGVEAMTAWKRSESQEKKLRSSVPIYLPWRHQKERALWRGLDAILPSSVDGQTGGTYRPPEVIRWVGHLASANMGGSLASGYALRVVASGYVYGTQDSLYDELIDDALVLNAFLMSSEGRGAATLVRECLEETDKAVSELGSFARNLRMAAGDSDDTANGARYNAKREAYFELDGLFRSWLASLGPQSDLLGERGRWRDVAREALRREAEVLVAQAGIDSHVGHPYKMGSRAEWMTAGRAETLFRAGLRKALPYAEDERRKGSEASNG